MIERIETPALASRSGNSERRKDSTTNKTLRESKKKG